MADKPPRRKSERAPKAPSAPEALETTVIPAAPDPPDPPAAEDAVEAVDRAANAIRSAVDRAAPLDLPEFDATEGEGPGGGVTLDLLHDVELDVSLELGRTRMLVEDVLSLNAGSIVELDKAAGDPVDIYVNDRCVARGEVLVMNDSFCVRVSEIVSPDAGMGQEGL